MRCATSADAVAGLLSTGMPASSATAAFSARPQAGKLKALTCTATPVRGTQDVLAVEARVARERDAFAVREHLHLAQLLAQVGVRGQREDRAVHVELRVDARVAAVGDGEVLPAGVVLVSHDRAFLDRAVTRVVEIEGETRKVHEYAGTWSEYEAARERARAQHARDYADYIGERERYATLLRDRRNQAHILGAERKLARQTGGSDRRATNALRGKVQQAKNHLERLEEVEKPWTPWRLELELPTAARSGALVAGLTGAVVERGSFRLGPISTSSSAGATASQSSARTAPARRR